MRTNPWAAHALAMFHAINRGHEPVALIHRNNMGRCWCGGTVCRLPDTRNGFGEPRTGMWVHVDGVPV